METKLVQGDTCSHVAPVTPEEEEGQLQLALALSIREQSEEGSSVKETQTNKARDTMTTGNEFRNNVAKWCPSDDEAKFSNKCSNNKSMDCKRYEENATFRFDEPSDSDEDIDVHDILQIRQIECVDNKTILQIPELMTRIDRTDNRMSIELPYNNEKLGNAIAILRIEADREKTQVERDRIQVEREKTQVEREKVQVECEKTQVEREKVQVEGEKTQVEREKVQVEDEKTQVEREKVQVEREKIKLETEKVQVEREKIQLEREKMQAELEKIKIQGKTLEQKAQLEYNIKLEELKDKARNKQLLTHGAIAAGAGIIGAGIGAWTGGTKGAASVGMNAVFNTVSTLQMIQASRKESDSGGKTGSD